MSTEIKVSSVAKDLIAEIVIDRYRNAYDYRNTEVVWQGLSAQALLNRCEMQLSKEYSITQKQQLSETYGDQDIFKYDSLTVEKLEAFVDWYVDIFIAGIDKVFTIEPTPIPTLDKETMRIISEQVKIQLWQRMQEVGVQDPELLMLPDGTPSPQLQTFIQAQVKTIQQLEKVKIRAAATEAATFVQEKMRDMIIEGDFRRAYIAFTRGRAAFGIGVMKAPDWQRRRVLRHVGQRGRPKMELVPIFRNVNLQHFFPSPDATLDLQSCLGVTERRVVSKIDLINLANQKNYDASKIEEILDEFSSSSRAWLPMGMDFRDDWGSAIWDTDQPIAVLVHQGYFSGDDLAEIGIKGIKQTDYVNAHVEVCGNRTIRCELLRMPDGPERSYFAAPFTMIGEKFWQNVGLAAKLYDTEMRTNVMHYAAMKNMLKASDPSEMIDSSAFENPDEINQIKPGSKHKINTSYAGSANAPDPIRPVRQVSAQYQLLSNQISIQRRLADDASGLPSYAYSGRETFSSLGEYAQRMSNALRGIKGPARTEDIYFTEPAFSALFRYLVENNDEFAMGQDLQCKVRGMSGLLEEAKAQKSMADAIPIAAQGVQMGVIDQDILKVTVRQTLEEMGVPVSTLSPDDDPLVNAIIDSGMVGAPTQATTVNMSEQLPQLDNRSNVVQPTMDASTQQSAFGGV